MMTRLFTVAFEWAGFTFMQVGIYAVAFSPDDINGTLIAITALIAAIGTAIVNIMAMREKRAEALRVLEEIRDAKEDARTQSAIVRADVKEVGAETKVVAGHVNSASSVLVTTNESLVKENTDLRAQLAAENKKAALLAQAAATAGVAQPASKRRTGKKSS